MSLRYALIGLLAERPMSGYELSKMFESSLNHVWTASHSQIYQELGRLTKDGLVEVVAEGPRGRKDYAATDEGVSTVQTWLTEREPDWSTRNEPLLRAFFLWLLEPEDARKHLADQIDYSREKLAAYEKYLIVWQPKTSAERAARVVLESGIRIERARLSWAEWAYEQYSQPDPPGPIDPDI